MEEAVSKAVCVERHKNVDEKFGRDERRLNAHSESIDEYGQFMNAQTEINKQILAQLQELQRWRTEQDKKLPTRVEFVVRQVIQWATLGLLALIAAKLGF